MTCLHCTPSQDLKIQLGSYSLAVIEMKNIQKNVVNGKFFISNKFSNSLLAGVDSDSTCFAFQILNNKHLEK